MSEMVAERIDILPEEKRMGITDGYALRWDRTVIVKLFLSDKFEVIGSYTSGLQDRPDHVRVAIARANAVKRLTNYLNNRPGRAVA